MKNPLLLSALCLTSASLAAQVPEGWMVVSQTSSLDGLSVVAPRTPAPATALSNVPAELVLTINVSSGASAVAIAADGDVVAGNLTNRSGQDVVIHKMRIVGLNVASTQRFFLGNSSTSSGSVTALHILADGRILFLLGESLRNSPLGTARAGTIDPVSGAIQSFPVSVGGGLNALAVDAAGGAIYFGVPASTFTSSDIFRTSLTGASPTLVGSLSGAVTGLTVQQDGNLFCSTVNFTPGVGTLDVATGAYTPLTGAPRNVGAVTIERATGRRVFAALGPVNPRGGEIAIVDANDNITALSTYAFGIMSGIAMRDAPRTYGAGSPGSNTYSWQTAPNPGGVPLLGNTNFSLTLTSSPGTANASAVLFGGSRASLPFLGVDLLLQPTFSIPIASQAVTTIPIAIANAPSIAGTVLHAQSVHIEPGNVLATSGGLTFGVVTP